MEHQPPAPLQPPPPPSPSQQQQQQQQPPSQPTARAQSPRPSYNSLHQLAHFKLTDVRPARQRQQLVQLRHQTRKLADAGLITDDSARRKLPKDAPRVKSKDLDLPFKRRPHSKIGNKLNVFSGKSKPKPRRSAAVTFHLAEIAMRDGDEELAAQLVGDLTRKVLRKKFPAEAHSLLIAALSRRMEKPALLLLDRGFPADLTAPIYWIKPSLAAATGGGGMRINTWLFPNYFMLAVALGLETVVRFMVKLGANVNCTWNGLTPLHIAATHPSRHAVLLALLEYGADPWIGVHFDQLALLGRLKSSYGDSISSDDLPPTATATVPPTFPTTTITTTPVVPSPRRNSTASTTTSAEAAMPLPLLSLPQRPVAAYQPGVQEMPQLRQTAAEKLGIRTEFARSEPASIPSIASTALPTKVSHSNTQPIGRISARTTQSSLLSTSSTTRFDAWKLNKFILPVAFAVASAHRPSVLALLKRMSTNKPRKTNAFTLSTPFSSASSAPLTRSGSQSSSSGGGGASVKSVAASNKDSFSLLIQQNLETTVYILKSGTVDLLQQDPRGANALHLAVRAGNIDLVSVLLHFDNAESTLLNSRGEHGWTALHEAISRKQLEIFRLLLKKGAVPNIKNDFGDTPLDLGVKCNIEPADVDQIWFSSLQRTNSAMTPRDSSSTVMPGSGANEFLFNLDPVLVRLLNTTVSLDDSGGSNGGSNRGSGRSLTVVDSLSHSGNSTSSITGRSPTERFGLRRHTTHTPPATQYGDDQQDQFNQQPRKSNPLKAGITKILSVGGFMMRKRHPTDGDSASNNGSISDLTAGCEAAVAADAARPEPSTQTDTLAVDTTTTVAAEQTTTVPDVTLTSPSPPIQHGEMSPPPT